MQQKLRRALGKQAAAGLACPMNSGIASSAAAKSCIALVVAAGRGTRLGAPLPKQYLTLGGVAVLRHSVQALLAHPVIAGVRVIIHPDDHDHYAAAIAGLGLLAPVAGGAQRQDSV